MNIINKINIKDQITWPHHRSGWAYAISLLSRFHNNEGVLFNGFLDNTLPADTVFTRPFVGVFHNTPYHNVPIEYSLKYRNRSVNYILQTKMWKRSKKNCLGLFALSEHLATFLRTETKLPVSSLLHPTEQPYVLFSMEKFLNNNHKKLLFIGHWMRNYHAIFQINPPTEYQKYVFMAGATKEDYRIVDKLLLKNKSVVKSERIPNEEYDRLFSENIIFLNLFDSSANNIVIECIVRRTPILINKIDGVVEYLGSEYPFYYDTLEEAESKLNDLSLIRKTHEYLKNSHVLCMLSKEYFLNSFVKSEVYEKLPSLNSKKYSSKKYFL